MEIMENYLEKKDEYKIEIIEKFNNVIINKINVGNVFKQMLEEGYDKNKNVDIADMPIKYIKHIYKKETVKLLNIIENNYFIISIMVINKQDESNEEYFNDDEISKKNESDNYDKEEEKEEEEENNNNSDKIYIENKMVKKISNDYFDVLEKQQFELYSNKIYENNLCLLYKIPNLFNLYRDINSYIKEKLKNEFFQNERAFRFASPKKKKLIN